MNEYRSNYVIKLDPKAKVTLPVDPSACKRIHVAVDQKCKINGKEVKPGKPVDKLTGKDLKIEAGDKATTVSVNVEAELPEGNKK